MKSRADVIDGLRRCADQSFCSGCPYYCNLNCTVELMTDAAELLRSDQGVIDQYRWERDTACDQLKEIGKGLGEKMNDIVELISQFGHTKPYAQGDDSFACEYCGETVGWAELNVGGVDPVKHRYCPNCGRTVDWDD